MSDEKISSRDALMLAAERHIALYGLAGSPLKAIHVAAGQRNASATHYHFGSRDNLIEAVLEARMGEINARRVARLGDVSAHGRIREIVAIWVEPLAAEIGARRSPSFYLRFIDRLRREAADQFGDKVAAVQHGYAAYFELIENALSTLPGPIMHSRIALAAEQIVSSLATLEGEVARMGPDAPYPEMAVNDLIDFIVGGLTAQVADATRERIQSSEAAAVFQLQFSRSHAESR